MTEAALVTHPYPTHTLTMRRRSGNSLLFTPTPEPEAAYGRRCDHPGCEGGGDYRAPRTREPRDGNFWFCLDHVRDYNAAWDFFAGMAPEEVESYQRGNAFGQRPTWRMGDARDVLRPSWVRDDMGLLGELGFKFRPQAPPPPPIDPRQRDALAMMDLPPEASLQDIRGRYKELVKRYHPDANGGDKKAEERLKSINLAYAYLLSCANE